MPRRAHGPNGAVSRGQGIAPEWNSTQPEWSVTTKQATSAWLVRVRSRTMFARSVPQSSGGLAQPLSQPEPRSLVGCAASGPLGRAAAVQPHAPSAEQLSEPGAPKPIA